MVWGAGGDVIRQEVAAKVDAETRLPVCCDPRRTADVGLDTQERLPSAAVPPLGPAGHDGDQKEKKSPTTSLIAVITRGSQDVI